MNRLYSLLLFVASLLLLGCSLSETANSGSLSDRTDVPPSQELSPDSTDLQAVDRICEFFDVYKDSAVVSFDKMLSEAKEISSVYGLSDGIYASLDSLCETCSGNTNWDMKVSSYRSRCLSFYRSILLYENILNEDEIQREHVSDLLKKEYLAWNKLSEDYSELMMKCIDIEYWGGTMCSVVQCYSLSRIQSLRVNDNQILLSHLQGTLDSYSAGLPTEVAVHAFVEAMDSRIELVNDCKKYMTEEAELTAPYYQRIDELRPIVESDLKAWVNHRTQISKKIDRDQWKPYIEATSVLMYDLAVMNHDLYRNEI